jgi:hypothetical protein
MSVTPIMWPILKKAGYSPNMAAGLVATGGIGAVLSPPLMGAASFLIMQFLGISFWEAVWKGANALTPQRAVGLVTPDALKYLHPGAQKFFKEKGALK